MDYCPNRCCGWCGSNSFIESWQDFNDNLDANCVHRISWLSWLFFDHVSPVMGEEHVLAEAIRAHKSNWKSSSEASHVEYMDDRSPSTGMTPNEAGPFVRVNDFLGKAKELQRLSDTSKVDMPSFFFVSGW